MTKAQDDACLSFDKQVIDLGDISENQIQEVTFVLSNNCENPIVIARILTTCGCTVTQKPTEPILSNESVSIPITFDPKGKSGVQNKVISVFCNLRDKPYSLRLTANIVN